MRVDALPAEIINDEGSSVTFELEGRFVELDRCVVNEVHRFDRHFTANDNQRPLHANPALIETGRRPWYGLMIVQIEYFYDLPVDFDGIRNPDFTILRVVKCFRDRGLA